ncbi:hypothetical protein BH23GEM8_BH23GEM8_03810 [soil metagenome]
MPLHLFIVHFPLALILVAAVTDATGAASGSERLRSWAGAMLMLGSFAALLAFLTGAGATSIALSRPQPEYQLVAYHSQWGGAAIWPIVGAGLLRGLWRNRLQGLRGWVNLAAAVLSAVLVYLISATGLAISH